MERQRPVPGTSEARVTVHVQPGASRDEVLGLVSGVLRVRVAVPPLRDKANRALVSLLAEALGVRQGQVHIVTGHRSKQKLVAIEGMEAWQIEAWLGSLGPAKPQRR